MFKLGIVAVSAVLLVVIAISGSAASDIQDQALIEAAGNDDLKLVQDLLSKGANANARSEQGWTALMKASASGSIETVKLLLDKGADVNAKDYEGTALIKASSFGRLGVVSLLLKRGADVNATDGEGRTALMVVCREGDKDVANVIKHVLKTHGAIAVADDGSKAAPSGKEIKTGLEDTWELLYLTDEQGQDETKPLPGRRSFLEFTSNGTVLFNRVDDDADSRVKSRSGKYRIEGGEVLITDDVGNTVRWPYQIDENRLIVSMPEVKKKCHWKRLR